MKWLVAQDQRLTSEKCVLPDSDKSISYFCLYLCRFINVKTPSVTVLCHLYCSFCCNVATLCTRDGTNNERTKGITRSANRRKEWVRQLSLFYFGDSLGDYLNCVVILNLTMASQWPVHVQSLLVIDVELPFLSLCRNIFFVVFVFNFYGQANLQLFLSRLEDLLFLGDPVKDIQGC